ncbi:hypothetical protein A2V56_00665 [Candidatus Woesebacteria bacterium RBG_19FT_COMBO_42_9]|uniref:Uncharacterized protein n=1 Tax=Candidatus Woesebacteria bacterium RBG_16_42_24 TaxID=1802485 RepID=A0A1F7XME7_9BACT|nr:MAG: hypothetical protein A2V97_00525 [Candidatus Woesebacteria bacterium RBG_16_42_24]OGM16547.1 MAG: hypothetical protein A2V56_00665 [Candidatus Woesebacteria bacterium RBG_19FT_COMBO_42_9]OGM67000.1 MAG: hypothetical protein A2985_02930 [Candidatus Woesebacteria bacterium RIFCSPLOWO2_01_FULL_43_11]
MTERKDLQISLSTASLWPLFSFMPTAWSTEFARKNGFEGLEILPGFSVCWEFQKYQELSAPRPQINSFHDSWKRDRRAEVEHQLSADTNVGHLVTLRSALFRSVFPSEKVTGKTLQGLETVYSAPVVFHWLEDTSLFQRPFLEVQPYCGASPQSLIDWVEGSPVQRGLVLDVSQRKFWEYLNQQKIDRRRWREVFTSLLPYTKEVHFQIGNSDELNQVISQNIEGSLGATISAVKQRPQNIPIVAEINPPILAKIGLSRFELSRKIRDFIRKA